MEKLKIGEASLMVEKNFSGIQETVDEIISLVILLEYKVNYYINDRNLAEEPYITIHSKEEGMVLLIEFGTRFRENTIKDVDIIIYEERLYLDNEEDRVLCYSLKEFRDYWDKVKLLL